MRKIIDRRQLKIEKARASALEGYYVNQTRDPFSLSSLNLNMYVDKCNGTTLKNELYKIFAKSECNQEIYLHEEQLVCLDLLEENNLLISAPTSFGKTFIALEYIKRHDLQNVAFVVPTLALMNEISRKIRKIFGKHYKIITDSNQDIVQSENHMFILVPERIDIRIFKNIQHVDLLVFDEIYKLNKPIKDEQNNKRIISLNSAYFNLVEISNKVLLLGPFINKISFNNTKLVDDITEFYTDYNPVYTKMYLENEDTKDEFVVSRLKRNENEIVYFQSPFAIFDFSLKIFDLPEKDNNENKSLIKWCEDNIDKNWLPVKLLSKGIGVHHGKMPAFIKKYIEYQYERGKIHKIFCTSTLLEGVNTPTESLIIYNEDDENLTPFALNNLIGRVGRLNKYLMGKVYYFKADTINRISSCNKYIDVDIVAEIDDIATIEEYVFLNKNDSCLSPELLEKKNNIEQKLSKYGKTIAELKNTSITDFETLLRFFDNEEQLILLMAQTYYETFDENDNLLEYSDDIIRKKLKTEAELFQAITKIVPISRKINNEIHELVVCLKNKNGFKGLSSYSLIHRLLKLNTNIYKEIKSQISEMGSLIEGVYEKNLLINIMFDLGNEYLKYDLQIIVYIFEFLYSDEFLQNKSFAKYYYHFRNTILNRIKSFDFGQDPVKKTLIDIGIPANNVRNIYSIIKKELENQPISYSTVLDALKNKLSTINSNSKLDEITKQLIIALVE